jgi:Putative auto-transporter adhesin, head GIN domain
MTAENRIHRPRKGAFLLILALVASSGCSAVLGERGSGDLTSEARQIDEFTGVALEGEGRVEIEVGDPPALTVEAEDNLLPLLTSEVRDGVLILGTTREVDPTEEIVYHVTTIDVDRLQVSGSGRIDAPVVAGEAVVIGVNGSGDVRVDVATAHDMEVDISGSGSVEISGEADTLEVSISGSGSLDAETLRVMTADVTIPGSGDVVVEVADQLEVDISGSGTVEYLGSPEVDSNISGSGSVDPR